jgi:acrylyl-CoA reductase (NADPH)
MHERAREFPRVPHPRRRPGLPQRHRGHLDRRPECRRGDHQDRYWSCVNYKDALAGTGQGKILRQFPLVGGIDVAGHVVESRDPRFREGDAVLVTGSGLSETRDGGYSEYARLEANWVVPLPPTLSAARSDDRHRRIHRCAVPVAHAECGAKTGNGPDRGDRCDRRRGHRWRSTSSAAPATRCTRSAASRSSSRYLIALGARQCIARDGLYLGQRPLESATWAGAAWTMSAASCCRACAHDPPVGGYVASCGLAGGIELHTTVMPFIIRGVSLLGVASAGTARDLRDEVWRRLSSDWKPAGLEAICTRETTLDGLPGVFATMLAGDSLGRTVVRLAESA